jgi:hypothetical protein
MAPPDDISFLSIVFLVVEEKQTTAPKPIKKNLEKKKNQIHMDVELGEPIIFAFMVIFPDAYFGL